MLDIEKQFPGVKALDHAKLQLRPGSIHALMGENGAGKSTLMKCLFGIYKKDAGSIRMNGKEINFTSPRNALDHGVAMVHQELNQVLYRSVMENMWLGRFPLKAGLVDHKKMYNDTKAVLDDLEIKVDPKAIIGTMAVSQRQMLEIAKAVSYNAKILVLDEPTSNLDMQAIMDLRSYVATAKAAGASVLVAEHRLWWLAGIADEIVVMGDGRVTKRLSAQEFASLSAREVRELGLRVRSLNDVAASARVTADSQTRSESAPRADGRAGAGEVFQAETGLDVRDARAGYRKHEVLRGVDLSVRAGEVVALVGRNGAGKSTLSRAICGLAKGSGAFRLFGKEVNERERLARSSMVFQDVNYQLFAESAASEVVFGLPKDRARSVDVEGILSSLGLRDVSGRHPATLSGGQKQRLAVASCVAAGKDVLVFDEPTSGLDLESMRRVASLIRRLADEGRVVLVVTHDLEFIACACDRAVELSEGVVAGSYDVAGGVGAIRRALFVDSQCDDWT